MPAAQLMIANLPDNLPFRLGSLTRAPINDRLVLQLRSLVLHSVWIENSPQLAVLIWLWLKGLDDGPSWYIDLTIASHVVDCLYLIGFGCLSCLLLARTPQQPHRG